MLLAATMLIALAPAPTAIVDSASGVRGLEQFALLEPGAMVRLGDHGRVRLAYFASCIHETIVGGTVRVGVTASLVDGARIERATGDCVVRASGQRMPGVPAALVLRDGDPEERTIHRIGTRNPVIVSAAGTSISVRRLDVRSPIITRKTEAGVVPLVALGLELEPGATYEFCGPRRCRRVQVDPSTGPDIPLLERIVPLAR